MDKSDKIIVGISIGDLNGIGVEVILKTFQDKRMLDFCTPLIFGSTKAISYHKTALNLEMPIHGITSINQMHHTKINVLNIWKEEVSIALGKPSKEAGDYAAKSLEAGVEFLKNKKIDVLLTAPINKETIQSDDFNFPGHTEYLLEKTNQKENIMIMVSNKIKIGFTICYDLRFPNLFRKLAKKGAQIILMPAAFTVPSGKAHWEVMLRSRAIENSLFLVATDMCGAHHTNRKTYGHSLLVNPWGKIIAKAKTKPKILNTNINLEEVEHARNKIPAILND